MSKYKFIGTEQDLIDRNYVPVLDKKFYFREFFLAEKHTENTLYFISGMVIIQMIEDEQGEKGEITSTNLIAIERYQKRWEEFYKEEIQDLIKKGLVVEV